MSKELVIGSNRHETKVAVLEEDQLVEVYFQRANEYSLAGSIHKGRVTRVLPGMQSAFVDLGLERDTFLYVSDFFEEHEDIDTVGDDPKPARSERRGDRGGDRGERRRGGEDRQRSAAPQAIEPRTEPVLLEDDREAATSELRFDEEVDLPVALSPDELIGDEQTPVSSGLSAPLTIPGTGENERSDDGRNRGDRRGRRSRRRRGRGRGIPENKYAQPSDVVSSTREALPADDEADEEDEPGSTPASDVIILPGESLAKYRGQGNRTTTPQRSVEPQITSSTAAGQGIHQSEEEPAWTSVTLPPPFSFGDLPPASPAVETSTPESVTTAPEESKEPVVPEPAPAAEELLLEEQAQDLVFADRVFAHHPEDVLAPTGPLGEPEPVVTEESHNFAAPFEPSASVEEAVVQEPEAETLVVYGARSSLAEQDEIDRVTADSSVTEESDEHFVASEAFETTLDGPVEVDPAAEGHETEAQESDAEPGEQTAVLREGNQNRPLQRSSRRMRRRRGGNRFGGGERQQAGDANVRTESNGAAPALEEEPATAAPARKRENEEERSDRERSYPSISDLLKPGQEIIVQIAKEPLGQKGARITSHVALPGRYVVFMPSVSHLGVSRKIASDEERQRLKRILQAHRSGAAGGFIVRTAGEGVPEDEIAADMNFLYSQWLDIRQKAEKRPAPALLHYDLDIVQRILRDQVTDDFKAIWVDSEEMYENVLTFMQRFQPSLVNRVKMYTRSAPIFDAFNITAELEKALRPKVWLKSGGYIVINQTEALVAIDINTGKYVGKSNRLEDTIVKTNTEAVKEIVRQIRLRDLGGIIVVDFIDMDERKNRQKVMAALEDAMRADKAPYKILQFNDFGLVAITRKRVKQSLERTLCSPCPYCEGAGYVKSVQTVIGEILVEAQKLSKAIEGKDVLLRVHPEVAKVLKASNNKYLEELEEILRRPVLVKGDPTLHNEKFDLG